jgi:hypothetical protein
VPFFEDLKLFEMPLLGFFGFPPFAIDCYVIWQLLVLYGVAVPLSGKALPAPRSRRIAVAAGAVVFCLAILAGMEVRTISSYAPRIADLPGVPADELQRAGFNVFLLGESSPELPAEILGASRDEAEAWVETARLTALRGIGTRNVKSLLAVCVTHLEDLANADPGELASALREHTKEEVVEARVRVWIRGAQHELYGRSLDFRSAETQAHDATRARNCSTNQLSTTTRPVSPFSITPTAAAIGVSPARNSSSS